MPELIYLNLTQGAKEHWNQVLSRMWIPIENRERRAAYLGRVQREVRAAYKIWVPFRVIEAIFWPPANGFNIDDKGSDHE